MPKPFDVSIAIGRFQIDTLHQGYTKFFDQLFNESETVVAFVGVSDVKNTMNNPLEYEARRQMLVSQVPGIQVYPLRDIPSDDAMWSKSVDALVSSITNANQRVRLVCSRDGFKDHYSGRYPVVVIEPKTQTSSTARRDQISRLAKFNTDIRTGIIYASQNRYPQAIPTVDVAIYSEVEDAFLFGQKKTDNGKWRFIGGFVEPGKTLEENARREAFEETGLEIGGFQYIGSFVVSDPRYRKEPNCGVITTLFVASKIFGKEVARDDIDQLKYVPLHSLAYIDIVPEHKPLLEALISTYNDKA